MVLFKKTETLRILQGMNHGWCGQPAPVPENTRIAYAACVQHLSKHEPKRPVLLLGPRRSGKTTILLQIANHLRQQGHDPHSICYLALDHPLAKHVTLDYLLKVYRDSIYSSQAKATLLLDEIQQQKNWQQLTQKRLADQYDIVATSSGGLLRNAKGHELPTTWIQAKTPPLSFFEFAKFSPQPPSNIELEIRPNDLFQMEPGHLKQLAHQCQSLLPLFQTYLMVSGFPEIGGENLARAQRLLREEIVDRIIKSDVAACHQIRQIDLLEQLFLYICLNSGTLFSITDCAKRLGTTKITISNHLQAFEQAHLIFRLLPFSVGGRHNQKARAVIHLMDPAIKSAMLLHKQGSLDDRQEMKTSVEATVVRHLSLYHYSQAPDVTYWRGAKTGGDISIIIRSPVSIIPTAVNDSSHPAPRARSRFVSLCRQEQVRKAYIVTRKTKDFGPRQVPGCDTKFMLVPAHIFVYLLGRAERPLWLG